MHKKQHICIQCIFLHFRVWNYFENKNNQKIVDPTPDKLWIRKKAMELGKILKPLWKEGSLPEAPSAIQNDMKNPLDLTGWSKSLQGVPVFTVTQMTEYHTKVNNTFVEKSKTIKKHFARGEQFVEENTLIPAQYMSNKTIIYFV